MTKGIAMPSDSRSSTKIEALGGLYGVRLVHNNVDGGKRLTEGAYCLERFHEETAKSRAMLLESERLCEAQGLQQWDQFPLRKLWNQRPECLKGCSSESHGDFNVMERVANVLTSIPFIFIGFHGPREKFETKLYANSTIGVGLASSLYHCSRGDTRGIFRKMDHMMIATSSMCLSSALGNDNRKALMVASTVLLPFQPILVTALHTGLMEVAFAQRVKAEPSLRRVHALHLASSLAGFSLFIADDLFPKSPLLHACWHLAAAVGVATSNKLLG